jgi:hypothetical protein
MLLPNEEVEPFSKPVMRLKWGRFGWRVEYPRPEYPYSYDDIMGDWDKIDRNILDDYYDKKAEYEATKIVSFIMQTVQIGTLCLLTGIILGVI